MHFSHSESVTCECKQYCEVCISMKLALLRHEVRFSFHSLNGKKFICNLCLFHLIINIDADSKSISIVFNLEFPPTLEVNVTENTVNCISKMGENVTYSNPEFNHKSLH